jgi:hypothetical protein
LTLFEKSRGIGIRFLNLYDKSPETPWKLRSLEFMAKFRISGLRIRMKIELNTKKHFPSFQKHPLPKVTDGSGDVGGAAVDSMQAGNGGSARGCGAGGSV